MIYILSAVVSFVGCFLKGFQHKNVIGGHLRSVFYTSYLMAACDFATVTLIVSGGWWIILSSGTGAAFGMVAAVKLHDRMFKGGKSERVKQG